MLTVIVPVYNEAENIVPLVDEIVAVSGRIPISEIIYVDDASEDSTLQILKNLQKKTPILRVIRHSVRSGQSAAFLTGVQAAGNRAVVLMDGDGQNDPADIPLLYALYTDALEKGRRVAVVGQRLKRNDTFLRRISSVLANKIRSGILGDGIRDTGCSLKLISRKDYLRLPAFNHMHRFLPALLIRECVEVLTVDVSHRSRLRGASKYGFWGRLRVGISDLAGVSWLKKRAISPRLTIQEL